MRTRHLFGVKPPVAACRKLKGKFVILYIILSNIHIKSVRRNVMHRFIVRITFVFRLAALFDVTSYSKFFFDIVKVVFCCCDIKSIYNRLKVHNFVLNLCNKSCASLVSPLELIISCKVLVGVLYRCKSIIKRDCYLLISIVVERIKLLGTGFNSIAISINKLAIYAVLVTFFSILKLLLLNIKLLIRTLKMSCNDTSYIS